MRPRRCDFRVRRRYKDYFLKANNCRLTPISDKKDAVEIGRLAKRLEDNAKLLTENRSQSYLYLNKQVDLLGENSRYAYLRWKL